jgi:cob(I)alamin adenosyltransferase
MKIYTKTGDKGSTALIGGKRVPKDHIRIEAYGTADELISFLAVLYDTKILPEHKNFILKIQEDLMILSAILAADCDDCLEHLPKLSDSIIVKLEQEIDRLSERIKPLNSFIIPGGHPAVSACHVARTVCRRTERIVLTLSGETKVPEIILIYLNRLSDYLFTLGRVLAADFKIDEIIWKPVLD